CFRALRGLRGHHCGDPRLACADTAAQCIRLGHSMDLQCLGYRRSLECFLPGQSRRPPGGAIGCDLFHSDFHRALIADHSWTRFPNSSPTSTATLDAERPTNSMMSSGDGAIKQVPWTSWDRRAGLYECEVVVRRRA